MTNDMTRGNPVRLILAFMIPTFLGNIFQQFYNLVDSVVAGRYIGVEALAAIGSTTSLIFLVTGWLQGITSGFSIMVAQCFGAGDYKQMRRYVAMSVYLCVAFVVVMTAGLMIFNVPVLRLMNTPDEILTPTAAYMSIIYAGLCVTAAYNAFAAVLRALGDGRSPLYFLIISAVINAGLDVLFIVRFHMGVEGCAYATVIAQGISALLCLGYIVWKFDILKLQKVDFRFDFSMSRRLLSIGVPMGLQFSITAIGTIIVQSAINVFGADYIAGYAAAGKLQNMINSIFIAFGATIATFVGQNRGAGKMDRVHQGVKNTQIMILISAAVSFLIIHFCAKELMLIFVDGSQKLVIDAADRYFMAVSWAYPFLGSIFLYRNALQGMGYGLVPMLGGVFELLARGAVVMLVLRLGGGYVSTCLSDPAAWVSALIPLIPYYFYKMRKYSSLQEKKNCVIVAHKIKYRKQSRSVCVKCQLDRELPAGRRSRLVSRYTDRIPLRRGYIISFVVENSAKEVIFYEEIYSFVQGFHGRIQACEYGHSHGHVCSYFGSTGVFYPGAGRLFEDWLFHYCESVCILPVRSCGRRSVRRSS